MNTFPRVRVPITLDRKQRGVVLLLFFLVLFLAGAGAIIAVFDGNTPKIRNNTDTMLALRQAKESLISYAVFYADNYSVSGDAPGYLPCPDTNGDGFENTPCNAANPLGRLPASIVLPAPLNSTIPLSNYNNDIDEQIWYSVADNFKRDPSAAVLNTSAVTTMTLDGQGGIAAVLIAPGPITGGQTRPSNNSNRYLEDSNTSSPSFVTRDPIDPDNFNDRVVVITVDEIFTPIVRILATAVKTALDAYHVANARYPLTQLEFDGGIAPAEPWFAGSYGSAAAPGVVTYTWVTNDRASLSFTGCDNISFLLDFNPSAIVQTGSRC